MARVEQTRRRAGGWLGAVQQRPGTGELVTRALQRPADHDQIRRSLRALELFAGEHERSQGLVEVIPSAGRSRRRLDIDVDHADLIGDRSEIGPGHIERLRERALGGLGSSRPGRTRAGLVLPATEPGHGATLVCRFVGGAGSVRPMCL